MRNSMIYAIITSMSKGESDISRRDVLKFMTVGAIVGAAGFEVGNNSVRNQEKSETVAEIPMSEVLANKIQNKENVKFLNGSITIPLQNAGKAVNLLVQSPLVVEKPNASGVQKFAPEDFRFFTVTLGPDEKPDVTEVFFNAGSQISPDIYPGQGTIMEATLTHGNLPQPDDVGRYAAVNQPYFFDSLNTDTPITGKGGSLPVGYPEYDFGK